jgi:hypothetical protein
MIGNGSFFNKCVIILTVWGTERRFLVNMWTDGVDIYLASRVSPEEVTDRTDRIDKNMSEDVQYGITSLESAREELSHVASVTTGE